MSQEPTGRRPKRQCVQRRSAKVPSAAHYVGYVEDDETPEMIMRKFEELEKVMASARGQKATAGPSISNAAKSQDEIVTGNGGERSMDGDEQKDAACTAQEEQPNNHEAGNGQENSPEPEQQLDESLLLQVFKQTSIFNVRTALTNNAVLMSGGNANVAQHPKDTVLQQYSADMDSLSGAEDNPSDEEQDLEVMKGFWSDDEFFSRMKPDRKTGSKKITKRSKRSGSVPPRDKDGGSVWKTVGRAAIRERNIRNQVVMQYNWDSHALIRRKVKQQSTSKEDIIQMRIPGPPLPSAWGRTVKPFDPLWPCNHSNRSGQAAATSASDTVIAAGRQTVQSCNRSSSHALQTVSIIKSIVIDSSKLPHQDSRMRVDSGNGIQPNQAQTDLWFTPAQQQQVAELHQLLSGLQPQQPCKDSVENNRQPCRAGLPASNAIPNVDLTSQADTVGPEQDTDPDAAAIACQGCTYMELPDIARCRLRDRLGERMFNVVLINSGWEVSDAGYDDVKLTSRLYQVPIPTLCPSGFVFIWTHKTNLQATFKQLYTWGYSYVENLTWVWMHANNTILRLPSTYCCTSHLTLLMFRKEGEGRDIVLRHQRNPDVILDCLRDTDATRSPPSELYSIIETMVPDEVAGGRCIELWAPRGIKRQGWVHVVEY